MASAVADLEAGLTAMAGMKPPGVSGSRISSLTSLCVANVQSESVLVQKLYTHFKKAASTHKLGTLYVVDSVTRKWLEQAKQQGQAVSSSAPDGSFAAGVHRVTELMPVLMNDIISSAPKEQKEKIKKLLDIWEKGNTFPAGLVEGWKQKLAAGLQVPGQSSIPSSTPPGSPPVDVKKGDYSSFSSPAAPVQPPPAAAAPSNTGSSLSELLAKLSNQKSVPAAPTPTLPAAAHHQAPPSYAAPLQQAVPPPSYPPAQAPVNMPYYPPPQNQQAPPPVAAAGFPGMPPAVPAAAAPSMPPPPVGGLTAEQMQLISTLAAQGMTAEQLGPLLQTMLSAAAPPASGSPAQYSAPTQQPWQQQQSAPAPNPRDRFKGVSPPRFGGRSRSRSPDRGYGRDRGYGQQQQQQQSPRGSSSYRQRSPNGRSQGENGAGGLPPVERYLEWDNTLPAGCIRVFSRTLFVGGVTVPDAELRRIFNRFGTVQTCITNRDKRHAFVKMLTRADALTAKHATEGSNSSNPHGGDLNLRTRWGVGFGPRDCSDYQTGISVIPINKLTEADRKWMLNAPYGGTGGRAIEGGMCVEEPDIEIGAGVSSKAISRRMQTDRGGSFGPRSTRDGENGGGGGGGRFGRGRDRGEDVNGFQGGGDGPTRWQ